MNYQHRGDICYSAEDIIGELEVGGETCEKHGVGFSKVIPFSQAPPFFQAPPVPGRRELSDSIED
ncbi:hypothetical protein ACFL0X_02820 [Nanoarchaeota archaeon]